MFLEEGRPTCLRPSRPGAPQSSEGSGTGFGSHRPDSGFFRHFPPFYAQVYEVWRPRSREGPFSAVRDAKAAQNRDQSNLPPGSLPRTAPDAWSPSLTLPAVGIPTAGSRSVHFRSVQTLRAAEEAVMSAPHVVTEAAAGCPSRPACLPCYQDSRARGVVLGGEAAR